MAKRMVILKITRPGAVGERYVRGLCEAVIPEAGNAVSLVGFSKIAREKLESIGKWVIDL